MRFTNICGMTIPERMVALQEMMQSLIDAIYGEYRWTANVSHVSETNVFTATDVINFNDDDFIVGQTVLFIDGYLGVIIEVDNSKNPKQFTAGYYMEIKGDKGDIGNDGASIFMLDTVYSSSSPLKVGSKFTIDMNDIKPELPRLAHVDDLFIFISTSNDNTYIGFAKIDTEDDSNSSAEVVVISSGLRGNDGANGSNGLDALTYNGIYLTSTIPSTAISFPTIATNFNRDPVVNDVFSVVFRGSGSVLNRSWLGTYKVISLGTGVANCSGSVVETTGQQGAAGQNGAGLVRRYMHTISYTPESVEDEPAIKIVIFSYNDDIIGDFSELIEFFNENGYKYEDVSYPATGAYKDADVVYNVWGIYYKEDEGSFYAQYGDNKVGVNAGTPNGAGLIDVIIDLGS